MLRLNETVRLMNVIVGVTKLLVSIGSGSSCFQPKLWLGLAGGTLRELNCSIEIEAMNAEQPLTFTFNDLCLILIMYLKRIPTCKHW